MRWKNWPYWLKGGVIGVIIWLILIIFYKVSGLILSCEIPTLDIMNGNCCYNFIQDFILEISFIPSLLHISSSIGSPCGHVGPISVFSFWIISFISYIMIGSLIGFIYGKIKNRNKKQEVGK